MRKYTADRDRGVQAPDGPERLGDPDNGAAAAALAYAEWIENFAPWRTMLTLTVSNEHMCSREMFVKRCKSLIHVLNRDLFGNHYFRICGHSYFSHILGIEYTLAGAIHGHMLVDRPIHYDLVHRLWNSMSGYAYIKPVDDLSGAARYISKYVVKRQDLELMYKTRNHKSPAFAPSWYSDNL